MKLRVGLVGLGDQWTNRHRPALKSLSDRFEVRAICCEVAHKSSQVAQEFHAVAYDGFRSMLENSDIDAVLALAPDWAGPIPILAACEAGKAVYSAAALDILPDQVEEIRRRVDASGVAFMAELPRRYAPATLRLKELIATRLGPPTLLFCHERLAVEQQLDPKRRGSYCPVTWRNLVELVDWCAYLVGRPPSSVFSSLHKLALDHGNSFYQMMSLEYSGEGPGKLPAMAQLSVGHYIPSNWPDALAYRRPASVQVVCANGVAFVDLPSTLIWFDEAGQHTESLDFERPVGEQMLTLFHRAVTSLVRKSSDINDTCRATSVVLAGDRSIAEGRRIGLPE
jgi:predicted dehydrogenase